ncbi:hypothetical protein ONE63_011587 [Megalurothrips usitatus]|uniref:Uncharacterized protein n=1 Tax=Megalurothrips usitatus TaxID=439358 RepID=A0AAV7WYX6_9NEOP|nr:hypothetical protein ONE63_011587 [Megalurothrips usitatus]
MADKAEAIIRVARRVLRIKLRQEKICVGELLGLARKLVVKLSDQQLIQRFTEYDTTLLYACGNGGVHKWRALATVQTINVRKYPMFQVLFHKQGDGPAEDEECLIDVSWYDSYQTTGSPEKPTSHKRHSEEFGLADKNLGAKRTCVGASENVNQHNNSLGWDDGHGDSNDGEEAITDKVSSADQEEGIFHDDEEETEPLQEKGKKKPSLPERFPLPVWSPLLQLEIKEGRLYMEENKKLLKQECVWHIVDLVGGMDPAQGTFAKFAKRLFEEPEYQLLEDTASINKHSTFAAALSKYLREQRALLEKRRQKQNVDAQAAVIGQPLASTDQLKNELELLQKNPNMNQNKAIGIMKRTFNLRQQIKFSHYKDQLTANKYLLVPRLLQVELNLHLLNQRPNQEAREGNFRKMLAKLSAIHGVEEVPDTEVGKLELVLKMHKMMTQKKYQNSKLVPVELKEVQPNQQINIVPQRCAFSLLVLTCNSDVKNVVVEGEKEIICKFPSMSAHEILETFVLIHHVFNSSPAMELEYFYDFLCYALYEKPIPTQDIFEAVHLLDIFEAVHNLDACGLR